jgi:hypothetical protein
MEAAVVEAMAAAVEVEATAAAAVEATAEEAGAPTAVASPGWAAMSAALLSALREAAVVRSALPMWAASITADLLSLGESASIVHSRATAFLGGRPSGTESMLTILAGAGYRRALACAGFGVAIITEKCAQPFHLIDLYRGINSDIQRQTEAAGKARARRKETQAQVLRRDRDSARRTK